MVKKGELLHAGKAKSVYRSDSDDRLILEFRDDITAFDGIKKDVIPRKGEFNAAVSAYVFEHLEARGIPTHYIRMLDDRRMLVRNLEMIPLEVIVRNIAAGSMVKRYPIEEGTPLDPPVIVIDYKDDSRHDPMLNDDLILALKILDRGALDRVRELSLEINRLLFEHFREKGLTLVDFKMEFGWWRGEIVLADEISMDSMRLWDTASGESMDKDVYRFGKGDVISAYAAVAERIVPGMNGGVE